MTRRRPTPGWDAVLLAGFGGPEGPDDVMPFLRNVTRGRGIPEERLVEVSHHYLALGGVSPINDQNRALRDALSAELTRRGIDLPVLWGNRNWAPFVADVVTEAHAAGQDRLLGLATSAYSSYSGCRQYREDFGKALLATDLVGDVRVDKIRHYYNHPGFLMPFADGTAAAVAAALDAGLAPADLEIVFTTHSIPDAMACRPAPRAPRPPGNYVSQHLAACGVVIDELTSRGLGAAVTWQLAYQSRSGPAADALAGTRHQRRHRPSRRGRPARRHRGADRLRLRPRRGGVGSGQRGQGDRGRSTTCSSPGWPPPASTRVSSPLSST